MTESVNFRQCAVMAAAAAIIFASYCDARAATIITTFNSPATENFDNFEGSVATIPANFTWNTPNNVTTPGGIYNSGGAYNNNNRWYALVHNPTSTTDRAFGARRNSTSMATPDTYELIWSFTNQTGVDIAEFNVAWNVEQYSKGGRPTGIDFNYNPNGTGATSAGIGGTTLTSADFAAGSAANLASPIITPRSVTITLPTPLSNGQSIDFRWLMISGFAGTGVNAHIGVDDLSVTAIPEPSTACIGGFGLVWAIAGLARNVGRRRNVAAGGQ